MGLLDRLRGSENRISAHGFQAAMSEWADGAPGFSRASIIANFELSIADESDLDVIKALWDTANTPAKRLRIQKAFDNIVLLVSDRDLTFYPTNALIVARLTEAVS